MKGDEGMSTFQPEYRESNTVKSVNTGEKRKSLSFSICCIKY